MAEIRQADRVALSLPPLRAALIGCGAIAHDHMFALQRLLEEGAATVVGVCDTSRATARWFGDRYESPWFTDAHQMLEHARPDVVHVTTPPATHVQLAQVCMDAGTHVIVEKPIASNVSELRELWSKADEQGVMIVENQNYRFNDGALALQEVIKSGRLGDLVELEVAMASGLAKSRLGDPNVTSATAHLAGGAIRDYLPHLAGLLLDLSGEREFGDVSARWWNVSGNSALMFDELTASVDLDGVLGSIRFSGNTMPARFSLTARGTAGTMVVDLFQPQRRLHVQRGPAITAPVVDMAVNGAMLMAWSVLAFRQKVMQHTPLHGIHRLVWAVYESLRTGGRPPIDRGQIERTARLVEALVESVDGR